MGSVRTHKDLNAWREAMMLAEMVYRRTIGFPKEEAFVLTAQVRRAAISIPSNIAEGAGRHSAKELVQYLNVARGSLAELETQLELAVRLGYIERDAELLRQVTIVGKLLTGLRRSVGKQQAIPALTSNNQQVTSNN
jgi:four helix bundle protein